MDAGGVDGDSKAGVSTLADSCEAPAKGDVVSPPPAPAAAAAVFGAASFDTGCANLDFTSTAAAWAAGALGADCTGIDGAGAGGGAATGAGATGFTCATG